MEVREYQEKILNYFRGTNYFLFYQNRIDSNLFDEVMVSTDDKEIAEIALKFGASVPFLRSSENSKDTSTTIDVINEVIFNYKQIGKIFDYTCCIYPCAPFINKEMLLSSFRKLDSKAFDCIFPVIKYGHPHSKSFAYN